MRIIGTSKRLALAALAVIAVGCQASNDDSGTESLDNFSRRAAMPVVKHQCSGDNEVITGLKAEDDRIEFGNEVSATTRNDLKTALKTSLSAVPTNLQLMFFGLGGKVVISHNVDAICRKTLNSSMAKTFASEGQSQIKSCWDVDEGLLASRIAQVHNDEGEGKSSLDVSGAPMTIYLNADTTDVRHSTVRIFSYILSQVLVSVEQTSGSSEIKLGAIDAEFREAQKALSQALLDDVKGSSKYDLSLYTKIARVDDRAFNDYVFAEAFDSYYCSAETRKIMASDFSRSMARFKMIAADLETLEVSDQGSSDGMALTAGYGLTFRGRLLAGIGRLAYGVARFAGRVVVGAANAITRVVGGVLHVAAGIVRGAVNLAAGIVRGVIMVAGRIVYGIARVAVGVVRVVLHPLAAANYAWNSNVVFGYPRMDNDRDGLTNSLDRCSSTVEGSRVWKSGQWSGCAGGQFADLRDADGDGINDAYDLCDYTPAGSRVWDDGPWTGCAGGQYRSRVYSY